MTNSRIPDERQFLTSDNTELFYRHWPAQEASSTPKVMVLFHRGHEHSGRLQHIVDELAMPDTAFYAWDARGHGRSPGQRGYTYPLNEQEPYARLSSGSESITIHYGRL